MRLANRRAYLWKKDPLCQICRVLTVLPSTLVSERGIGKENLMKHLPKGVRDRMATIDHLDNRFDPGRGKHSGKERTRLVCWKCNFERGKADYEAIPLEIRQKVSSHGKSVLGAYGRKEQEG
jgi:hypothetical protein